MSNLIRQALQRGIVFGILTAFLFLVGFTGTAANIFGDLLRNENAGRFLTLTPAMLDMLIFLGLIGLWAGSAGASGEAADAVVPVRAAVFGGGSAGLMHGLIVGGLAWLVGTLNAGGVQMSGYLAELLPAAIKQFLIGFPPAAAGGFYLAFMILAGVLGGAGNRLFGRARRAWAPAQARLREKIEAQPLARSVRANPASRYVLYGALLAGVLLLPLVAGPYWNYTIGTVGIYVLLGLGLNIVVGLAGLLDLGYVAFFAIGAYAMALLTAPTPHNLLWNFWLVIPVAIVLAAVTGILLGAPVLRMRGDYLAIVTLGFGEIIRILSKSDELTPFTNGPKGVPSVAGPWFFGLPLSSADTAVAFVYLIFLAALLVIFVTMRLQNSRVGRAWEAMREDETVSRGMGINTLTQKLLAFAIGAAFAGLGGALFASRNQFTGPEDFNLMVSINVVSVVIVGGMGSIPGVIAGALVLKGLPEVLRQLEDYRVMVFGALLVVMMLWRPSGLIPSARRKMEAASDSGVVETREEGRGG
jgi:ABC-type branched-subunit amino acid transport system permease subunit